ncbi:MAG: hypothetical protein MUO26_08290 [Methanotrichaceae archaeon]|nr:hypothetical protein [Methanotrichaceae archaeon]
MNASYYRIPPSTESFKPIRKQLGTTVLVLVYKISAGAEGELSGAYTAAGDLGHKKID